MDPQLRSTCAQVIYLQPERGARGSGHREIAIPLDPTEIAARVEEYVRIIQYPNGSEAETTHRVITETEISPNDRIWLPGTALPLATGTARRVLAVRAVPDELGTTDHYEALV